MTGRSGGVRTGTGSPPRPDCSRPGRRPAAARMEDCRRRRRVPVLFSGARPPLHDGRARRHRIRDGLRRRHGKETVGTRERTPIQQRPGGWSARRHQWSTARSSTHSVPAAISPPSTPPPGRSGWTVNVLQKFGGSNIRWGLSESPLVLQDRILLNPGGRGASIVAVKKTDGSEIWRSGNDAAGYSSRDRNDDRRHPDGRVLHRRQGSGRRHARRTATLELRSRRESDREHRHADRARQQGVHLVRLRHRRRTCSSRRPVATR